MLCDDVVRAEMNQVQQLQLQQAGTTVLYNAAGQPVAITLPPQLSSYESYNRRQSITADVILVTVGFLSIVFNGIGMSFWSVDYTVYCFSFTSKLFSQHITI